MIHFLFYLMIDFLAIILFYLGIRTTNITKKKCLIILSFIVLFILVGFRSDNVGEDYKNVANTYARIANGIPTAHDISWFGYPLYYICRILSMIIGDSAFLFYYIIGFLTLFFLYKGILKNSNNPTVSLFILISFCLYYQLFNQSRQMLALSIVLYSLKYLKDKNFFKYTLIILLASAVHNTALVMLPAYFFLNIKFSDKSFIFYFFCFLLITLLGPIIIQFAIQFTKYSIYIDTKYNVSFATTAILNAILRFVLYILTYLFYKKCNCNNRYDSRIFNYAGICLIVQGATLHYYFLGRLTTYFFGFYIFIFADIIDYIKSKYTQNYFNKKQFLLIMTIFVCIFTLYHAFYYFSSSGAVGAGYDIYSFIDIGK